MSYDNSTALRDRAVLAVATHHIIADVRKYTSLSAMQWVVHTAAGVASTINVYASGSTNGKLLGKDGEATLLDPATNPRWSLTPIVFAALPAGLVGSSLQPFTPPGPYILFEVVVTTQLDDFSLLVWGAGTT